MMTTKTIPPVTTKPDGKNVEVKLRKVRLSFCDVFAPIQGTDQNGNPTERFYLSTNVLLDKNTPEGQAQIAAVRQAMKDARAAEWGTDNPPPIAANCLCLQDGEPVDPNSIDDEHPQGVRRPRWEGYEGQMYISANRVLKAKDKQAAEAEVRDRNPVQILGPRKTAKDAQGNPIFPTLREVDGLIYSGCWADVIIRIYPYNATGKNHPSRINASLEAIKFVEHGTPFGGRKVDAQNAFDEEDEDELDHSAGAASSPPPVADDLLG